MKQDDPSQNDSASQSIAPFTSDGHGAVRSSDLVRRLRVYIAWMSPHQRNRQAGKLLIEATEMIECLERVLEARLFNEKPSNS